MELSVCFEPQLVEGRSVSGAAGRESCRTCLLAPPPCSHKFAARELFLESVMVCSLIDDVVLPGKQSQGATKDSMRCGAPWSLLASHRRPQW